MAKCSESSWLREGTCHSSSLLNDVLNVTKYIVDPLTIDVRNYFILLT